MGSVKVEKFGGMLPAWESRVLPDSQAEFARDAYLYSGAAMGWRKPKLLRALLNSVAKYVYRIPLISQAIAAANLVFTGNPNPGDTVTIGEITYTWKTTAVNPYDIQIQSTTLLSAQVLFLTVVYGSFDTQMIGGETPANPAVAGVLPVIGWPYAFTSTTSSPGNNTIFLVPISPQATTDLTSVNCVPAASNALSNFTGVVYENINTLNATGTAYINIPSSLIASGAQATGAVSGVPVTSSFNVPIILQGGSTYWIGFIVDNAVALHQGSLSTSAVSNANVYANGPPNPFVITNLSGVTVGGSTVGTLQSLYNINQPNWQIWGTITTISPTDAENIINVATIGGNPYNYINFQAPSWGSAYNQTPLAFTGTSVTWLSDLLSFADTTAFLVGGANQTMDTTITGTSTWIEFLDQDTNVLRTPIVDDIFQRYYFASPSQPPQYNTYERIKAGSPALILGVPAPSEPPELTIIGGGNPTQFGFPTSSVATNENIQFTYWNTAVTPNTWSVAQPAAYVEALQYILYPVSLSQALGVSDIGIQVSTIGINQTLTSYGILCLDNGGTPGDVVAITAAASTVGTSFLANGGTAPLPATVTMNFPSSVSLQAKTQYWLGVILQLQQPQTASGANITLSMADNNTFGMTVVANPNNGISTFGYTFDTTTGNPTLAQLFTPAATAWPGSLLASTPYNKFPDIVIWADVTPGTGAQIETRAYITTWVTAYGEEGPPSPPALLSGYDNALWKVEIEPPLPEDLGLLRNIVQTNIYRTMSSKQGGAVFFYVGTVNAQATVFADSVTDDLVALNRQLSSTTWFAPPTTLQGLVSMPNGMMAGFRGNEVWFCEPFRPHAWPAGYVMTTDYPIIGLGVTGNTLVAATNSNPHTFTGNNPSVMVETRLNMPEPCIARGSLVSTENGVYYQSANGLIHVSSSNVVLNLTQDWITREKWAFYTPQKFVRAIKNNRSYFAYGTTSGADTSVAQQGFTLELSEAADRQGFTLWPQVGGHRIGLSTLTSHVGLNIDNVEYDPWSGVALLVAGGSVYYYDFTDQAPTIVPYIWRSKKFQGPHKENFGAYRVWFDIPPGGPQTPPPTRTTLPATFAPPTSAAMALTPGMFGIVRVIGDGAYLTERELRFSTELMRIASSTKYTTWQIEIEARVSVTNVKAATSVKELGDIK
jgi:hypothetical protein